jgi:Na+/proline symporter
MRFVQFYFGLPLAMIVLCVTFVPIFHRLKVYTAYEFLENRFGSSTRTLTVFLFLLQRGLSTGISIYAPSIILSTLLNWNIYVTNLFMGGLLIFDTVSGGAKAVAHTQKFQLMVIFAGMFFAGYMVMHMLPEGVGISDAVDLSSRLGKMNVVTTGFSDGKFDWGDRYNVISGIIGGLFLQLSYFGADQSQVGRYLTAKSIKESRLGLIMNGIVKIPMQFAILFLGILVFTFYMFTNHPATFNGHQADMLNSSSFKPEADQLQAQLDSVQDSKRVVIQQWLADKNNDQLVGDIQGHLQHERQIQDSLKRVVKKIDPLAETNDTNYIFLRFVIDYLPAGLVGLLIAVIFLAGWGSIAAALNSLSSTSVVDIHKKYIDKNCTREQDYRLSKRYTLIWGIFCMLAAMFATRMGSLIEAVNILGSLFYGVILGIFLVAFYMKKVGGKAVFTAAVISELIVLLLFMLNSKKIIRFEFLWLNVAGAVSVMLFSLLIESIQSTIKRRQV